MKYLILFLISLLAIKTQPENSSIKTKLTDYFTCLKNSDIKKFNDLLIKEAEYKRLDKSQSINGSDKKNHTDFIQISNTEFERVIANAKKNGVNWANTVLDSIVLKEDIRGPSSLVNGKIYFRLKDNSTFYFINIINLTFLENSLLFSKQYSPAENYGPKNRILTQHLKEEYIINVSKLIRMSRDWAEGQYYRDTDMADGVELVKSKIAFCKKELAKKK